MQPLKNHLTTFSPFFSFLECVGAQFLKGGAYLVKYEKPRHQDCERRSPPSSHTLGELVRNVNPQTPA